MTCILQRKEGLWPKAGQLRGEGEQAPRWKTQEQRKLLQLPGRARPPPNTRLYRAEASAFRCGKG